MAGIDWGWLEVSECDWGWLELVGPGWRKLVLAGGGSVTYIHPLVYYLCMI